jgi:hypothetical protein
MNPTSVNYSIFSALNKSSGISRIVFKRISFFAEEKNMSIEALNLE